MIYGFNGKRLSLHARSSCLTVSKALLKSIVKNLTALQFGLSKYLYISCCMLKSATSQLPPFRYAYWLELKDCSTVSRVGMLYTDFSNARAITGVILIPRNSVLCSSSKNPFILLIIQKPVYSAHHPKPVYSTNIKATTKKLAGLRLLDAKVYLNRNEDLRSSVSVTVNHHPNISTLQNPLGIGDINCDVLVYAAARFRNDLQDLPMGKIHPRIYNPEDDLSPLLSSNTHTQAPKTHNVIFTGTLYCAYVSGF